MYIWHSDVQHCALRGQASVTAHVAGYLGETAPAILCRGVTPQRLGKHFRGWAASRRDGIHNSIGLTAWCLTNVLITWIRRLSYPTMGYEQSGWEECGWWPLGALLCTSCMQVSTTRVSIDILMMEHNRVRPLNHCDQYWHPSSHQFLFDEV